MKCKPGCEFYFIDEEHGPICGHCDDQVSRLLHCPRGMVRTLDDHKLFKHASSSAKSKKRRSAMSTGAVGEDMQVEGTG